MSDREDIHVIKELLLQWLSGVEMDAVSAGRLKKWADVSPDNRLLMDQLKDNNWIAAQLEKMRRLDVAKRWQLVADRLHQEDASLTEKIPPPMAKVITMERTAPRRWGRAAVVALLVVCAGMGLSKWWMRIHRPLVAQLAPTFFPVDKFYPVDRVATSATLTLQNDSVITLDNSRDRLLADMGNIRVVQVDSMHIVYHVVGKDLGHPGGYNMLKVPDGKLLQLTMEDGTKVWLNGGSSCYYSVTGLDREVGLQGEAYFEVAHNASLPFRVKSPSLTTEVLGTAFNVRDYPDEPASRATLAEGKVKVGKGNNSNKIDTLNTVGEEALAKDGLPGLVMAHVSLAKRIAWWKGFFYFDPSDIRTTMHEVARWYRVSLAFREGADTIKMADGKAFRGQTLATLLRNLEREDLHFSMSKNNDTLIVSR